MDNFDNRENELKDLLNQLDELKKLRAELSLSEKNISETVKDNEEKIEKAKEEVSTLAKSSDIIEELKRQVIDLDKEIEQIEDEILKNVKEYESSYSKLQNLVDDQNKKLDSNELLSEEAIKSIKDDNESLIEDATRKSKEIKAIYEKQRKLLSALKGKRTKLKKDIEKCEALDLTMEEYNEINSALRKSKIVDAILEKKGLIDIISKPSKERTKEEKEQLKIAKEEILKEISEVKKANNDYSVLDAIQALYSLDVSYVKGKTRVIEIPKNELAIIKENAKKLPVLIKDYDNVQMKYTPTSAPKDMEEVKDENLNSEESIINPNINERIVIFKDKDTGDLYIREYVKQKFKDRFKLDTYGEGVRINGSLCYKIDQDEADYIINNANNDFSPYLTRIDEVELPKEKEYSADDYNIVQEAFDELVNNGYKPGTEEFAEAVNNIGSVVENEFEIGPDDTIDELIPGTNIKRPRYRKNHETDEEYEEFLKNYYSKVFPQEEDDKDKKSEEEDLGNTTIPTPVPTGSDDSTSEDDDTTPEPTEEENDNDKERTTPVPTGNDDLSADQQEQNDKEEEILSARKIVANLTKDLEIFKKDGKRYIAAHIEVTQEFKNELHAGNYIYNIGHIASALVHIPFRFVNKVWSKLALGPDGEATMKELEERLNNLPPQQLQVLYDQYKGTTALSDMNHQILPMIQKRLRAWVIDKVQVINQKSNQCYSIVASIKNQLEEIDKKLEDSKLDPKLRKEYLNQRKELIRMAALNIKMIEDLNLEGQKWLSDGLHGLEEDYKAVMTKMNYVGLRFAKEHDFDNELAEQIGDADENLKRAIRDDDSEKIYSSFMKREQLYIDNTEVKNSIFGKRSVGKKYYTPLAQILDYKDDPLIRDLFTTIALTTAAISVINAIRVHGIEDQAIIANQQSEAARVNAANDQIIAGVKMDAQRIVDGREAIRDGLQAQVHQDVLNTANGLERYALDHFNWVTRGNGYRALDDANHAAYNTMYQQVSGDISSISARLSSGAIAPAKALEEMGTVAAGAQHTFTDVAKTCLDELNIYIPAHPQFDLTATKEALEYIVNNPTALTRMNETAINATNIAEGMMGLSPAHMQALSSLPSDWITTLMGAAGSAALAYNVTRDMAKISQEKSRVKQERAISDDIASQLKGEKEVNIAEEIPYEDLDEDIVEEEEEVVSHR